MVLHRIRFPPEVFHFLFTTNWAQWSYLNNCQRFQRIQNLRQLCYGCFLYTELHLQFALHDRRTDSPRTSLELSSLQNNILGLQHWLYQVLAFVFDLRPRRVALCYITYTMKQFVKTGRCVATTLAGFACVSRALFIIAFVSPAPPLILFPTDCPPFLIWFNWHSSGWPIGCCWCFFPPGILFNM